MLNVPSSMTSAWRAQDTIGDRRPMFRVTVQHPQMQLHGVAENSFANYLFGANQGTPLELVNTLKLNWTRAEGQEVGTGQLELLNVAPMPIGQTPPSSDFDLLGYYTPQRGGTAFSSRWGHLPNEFTGMLLPDNLLRTYEGYGFDPDVCPSQDPNLVQTGVWSILDVDFTHDGRIVIEFRDLGGPLLNEQIAFPPVVPFSAGPVSNEFPDGKYAYPVQFQSENPAPIINRTTHVNVNNVPLSFDDSSNTPYLTSKDSTVYGHRGTDAFDGDTDSYWLSIGNARGDQGYSFEWVQGKCSKTAVTQVRFKTKGTGYTAYIGIYADGEWKTSPEGGLVPYDPNHPASAPNGSDENYVKSLPVTTEGFIEVDLPETYQNVTKVRVTFGNLWDSGLGDFQHRAGVRELQAKTESTSVTETRTEFDLKNYDDYVDIVKLFLAWGGFFWPDGAYELDCDGNQIAHQWTRPDNCLPLAGSGRVWGDFKPSGTYGPATLGIENFDKKPLLDCIGYIKDILGYIFFIDEQGGAVFRPPNVYSVGNYVHDTQRGTTTRAPNQVVTIDEVVSLQDLSAKLSGRNFRERTFVSNTDGSHGAMAAGWIPNPTGLRRVGGWTDQNFETQGEVQIMADMITLRQLFTFREDSLTIKGYPRIQVDDQIRIYERTTNEGYLHYVKSIESDNDLTTGKWSYQIGTHWLGEQPFERWVFDPGVLGRETRRYLEELFGAGEESV